MLKQLKEVPFRTDTFGHFWRKVTKGNWEDAKMQRREGGICHYMIYVLKSGMGWVGLTLSPVLHVSPKFIERRRKVSEGPVPSNVEGWKFQ